MESVRCARAMGCGIGEWTDDLQLLDDRAGPPVRDDERQRVFMFRTDVNEMNVEPVDLGDELRQGIEPRLRLAPVVIGLPVARELLDGGQLHALGWIRDGFLVRPAGGGDAPAQVDERVVRKIDAEGADFAALARFGRTLGKQPKGTRGSRSGTQ